jgi:hypothetical protein
VKRIQLADRGLGVFDIGEEPVRVMFRSPVTFGSAACCVEWLRLSEPIPYSLGVGDEAAFPPVIAAPHRRRSLRKRENELRVRPERLGGGRPAAPRYLIGCQPRRGPFGEESSIATQKFLPVGICRAQH